MRAPGHEGTHLGSEKWFVHFHGTAVVRELHDRRSGNICRRHCLLYPHRDALSLSRGRIRSPARRLQGTSPSSTPTRKNRVSSGIACCWTSYVHDYTHQTTGASESDRVAKDFHAEVSQDGWQPYFQRRPGPWPHVIPCGWHAWPGCFWKSVIANFGSCVKAPTQPRCGGSRFLVGGEGRIP